MKRRIQSKAPKLKNLLKIALAICILNTFFCSSFPVLAEENELTTDIQELDNGQEPQNEPLEHEEQPSDETSVIDEEATLQEQQDVIANHLYEELTMFNDDISTFTGGYDTSSYYFDDLFYFSKHGSLKEYFRKCIKYILKKVDIPNDSEYILSLIFDNDKLVVYLYYAPSLTVNIWSNGHLSLNSINEVYATGSLNSEIFDISTNKSNYVVGGSETINSNKRIFHFFGKFKITGSGAEREYIYPSGEVMAEAIYDEETIINNYYDFSVIREFSETGNLPDGPVVPPVDPNDLPACTAQQIPVDVVGENLGTYFYEGEAPVNYPKETLHLTCTHDGKKVYHYIPGSTGGGGDGGESDDYGWFQPLVDFFTGLFAPILSMLSTLVSNILTGLGSITIPLPSDWVPQAIKEKMPSSQSRMGLTLLIPIGLLVGFILMGVANVFAFDFTSIPKFFQSVASYFFVKINDPQAPSGVLATTTQFALDVRNTFSNLFGGLTTLPNMLKGFIDGFFESISATLKNTLGIDLSFMSKVLEDIKDFIESIPTKLFDIKEAVLGLPLSLGKTMADALGDVIDLSPLLKGIKDAVLGIPFLVGSIKDSVLGIPDFFTNMLNKLGEILAVLSLVNLINAIQEMLKLLFVPSPGFFSASFQGMMNKFNLKLPIIGDLSNLISTLLGVMFFSTSTEAPSFTITLPKILGLGEGTYEVINWQFYEEYRTTIHAIIILFVYGFTFFALNKKLTESIRGI